LERAAIIKRRGDHESNDSINGDLLAAVTVVGATWAVGQASSSESTSVVMQGESPKVGNSEIRSAPPEGTEFDGGDAYAAPFTSRQGWLGFTESVVPIAVIITLVALPMSLWKRNQRTHMHPAPAAVG